MLIQLLFLEDKYIILMIAILLLLVHEYLILRLDILILHLKSVQLEIYDKDICEYIIYHVKL